MDKLDAFKRITKVMFLVRVAIALIAIVIILKYI